MSFIEESVLIGNMEVLKFGKIKINGQEFDLLNQPLSNEKKHLIYIYKKINNHMKITSPRGSEFYEWILEDDKLYLTGVYFDKSKNANLIGKIFHEEKIEATWLNSSIKILMNTTKSDVNKKKNIFILEFKHGLCVSKPTI